MFWDLTILEVEDVLTAKGEFFDMNEKRKVENLFVLADAISSRIAYAFDNSKDKNPERILQPWDVFPEAFKDAKAKRDEQTEKAKLEDYKARRREWAEAVNERMANKGD